MNRHWTKEQLIESFTLNSEELGYLKGMVNYNRLGFAILLKSFQNEGRFPENPFSVPQEVVEFLAKQLKIPPLCYQQYDWQGRTIKRHRMKIRNLLGFRPYSETDREKFIQWLYETVLPHNQKEEFLQEAVSEHLRANRIESTSQLEIERIIHSAQNTYENHLFEVIYTKLSQKTRLALDKLLQPEVVKTKTSDAEQFSPIPLLAIKTSTGEASLNTLLDAVNQLEHLRQLDLPPDLFRSVSPKTVERFRGRAAVEVPSQLRRHPKRIRYTLLAALCLTRQREITDDLVECLIQIIHKMGTRAQRKVYKELLSDLKRVSGKTNLLFQIAEAALSNPSGSVEEVIYPVASEEKLHDLVAEYRSSGPAYRIIIHTVMRNSYSRHYRRMVPKLLQVLDFRTNNTLYQPLIDALKLLRKYLGSRYRYFPQEESIPIEGVVRPSLIETIFESNSKGEQRINRINYEMCVLSALRDGLRNKSIWVEGANRYRNPDEDLPADFDKKRITYYQALNQPLDPWEFINRLKHQMLNALDMIDKNLPNNDKVHLKERQGSWISITPLPAQPEPKNLSRLKEEIAYLWPMTSLLDTLKETDLRVNFTQRFAGVGNREILPRKTLQKRLLLCLYGLGTNMGLKQISNMNENIEGGEQYGDLYYVYQRYLYSDSLRSAIAAIINDTFRIRQSHIWGEGTTACASDSRKFAAWDQNLLTEWHIRYHGRGVMVYWHLERHSACIHSQLRSCSSSEVAAMIEGVLRHCTDMEVEKNYVDSHGQSEVGFAFCYLFGFELLPRLKAIGYQRLYRPEKGDPQAYSNLQPILTRPINWDLIAQHYDEMIKYATAIRLGTASADSILKRFTRNTPQHPAYRALAELGKALKTIFLCRYLASEELRREIHEGLNVIESWNSTNDKILIGKGGEISSNRLQTQELTILSMHLLQASLVYINTLMIQRVLAQPGWLERMTEEDWRGLTPLIHHHINPYGTFELDMDQRLPNLQE